MQLFSRMAKLALEKHSLSKENPSQKVYCLEPSMIYSIIIKIIN